MKDLLSDAHCPLLLLREDGMPPDKLILAYDGSYSSIYAIKQFRYLFSHLSSLPAFLVTIAADEKKGIAHGDMLKHWAPYHFQNPPFPASSTKAWPMPYWKKQKHPSSPHTSSSYAVYF